MIKGFQYENKINISTAGENGFCHMEIPYGEKYEPTENVDVIGVLVKLSGLTEVVLKEALTFGKKCGAKYLVIETRFVNERAQFKNVFLACLEEVKASGLEIYIENGYILGSNGRFGYSEFSTGRELRELISEMNEMCNKECFGACVNVGYGNLLVQNVRMMIDDIGAGVKLIHANDNDGVSDLKQMPFTFTKGRGDRTTDWYRIIAALIRLQYKGFLVFDLSGTFSRCPEPLQGPFFKLLNAMVEEWEEEFHFEEKLNHPEKELILFGAGNMAWNFMQHWGTKYRPSFLVDNSEKIWGQERFGIQVKSPKDILDIPPEKRNVFICNMYYAEIGKQLDQMGIEYQCYWDQYYL